MLACKHERPPFGSPMCEHLRVADAKGGIDYVRWYIGSDLDAAVLHAAEHGEHDPAAEHGAHDFAAAEYAAAISVAREADE